MGALTTISAQLVSVLQSVNAGGSSAFVQVLDYPSNQFTGIPSATVVPTQVQSQYATVQQNRRSYGFELSIYTAITDETQALSFTQMRDLVDIVLDKLDKTLDLNGTVDFLIPVTMDWQIVSTSSGMMLVAPIHIICEKDIALY